MYAAKNPNRRELSPAREVLPFAPSERDGRTVHVLHLNFEHYPVTAPPPNPLLN